MRWLLDTNIVSELRKGQRAHPAVLAWRRRIRTSEACVSVITLMELALGIALKARKDEPAGLGTVATEEDSLHGSIRDAFLFHEQHRRVVGAGAGAELGGDGLLLVGVHFDEEGLASGLGGGFGLAFLTRLALATVIEIDDVGHASGPSLERRRGVWPISQMGSTGNYRRSLKTQNLLATKLIVNETPAPAPK